MITGLNLMVQMSFCLHQEALLKTAIQTALDNTGYVYIYYPVVSDHNQQMRAAPYAIVVSPSTGRIRISRWIGGAWNRK